LRGGFIALGYSRVPGRCEGSGFVDKPLALVLVRRPVVEGCPRG
jgi:hypothetical protein